MFKASFRSRLGLVRFRFEVMVNVILWGSARFKARFITKVKSRANLSVHVRIC
jgi:hypothetical protein